MSDGQERKGLGETPDSSSRDEILAEWSARLSVELGLAGLDVNVDAILRLAGVAAHSIVRPAAPLTTFIVGYAAGIAAADGHLSPEAAIEAATATALQLAQGGSPADSDGQE